jgi:hypothetical protein
VERSKAPPLLQIVVVELSQPSQQTFGVFCTAGERKLPKERPDYSDVATGVKPFWKVSAPALLQPARGAETPQNSLSDR